MQYLAQACKATIIKKGENKVKNLLKRDKGFTLIEIVLVLAIAGLLLVIVFLAVQGANRSRRDAQRKQDAARMLAAITECASNHNGSTAVCTGATPGNVVISDGYFSGSDPNGTAYTLVNPPGIANMWTGNGAAANCPGTTAASNWVLVYQEAGASYCSHN